MNTNTDTLPAPFLSQIAALYVDPTGPYPQLLDEGDWFDQERDARTFAGGKPVVAHPPCGPWGKLAWRCTHQDRTTGFHAVAEVRRNGGVLEHPMGSQLFQECGIPVGDWDNPERETDAWGGYTIRVRQADWGHRGEKDTILYIVGTAELPPMPHQLDATLRPVQNMGKRERRLSPGAFAWWLCAIAARCVSPYADQVEAEAEAEGVQLDLFAA
jgi:hypothetical protein